MLAALSLATGAALATVIGSILGVLVKNPGPRFMSFTLGFSAGVMILVSFSELLPQAISTEGIGFLNAHLAFFTGMVLYSLIDFVIPHEYIGQRDYPAAASELQENPSYPALERTGLVVALGIGIHNLPEGMATFVGAMEDIRLGMAIALAIAIHNIPEGVAISAPIYAATGNRRKAFLWSFLSGISEVGGALLAAAVLMPILTELVLGYVLAIVGGIMVAISLDELIPAAQEFAHEHAPMMGTLVGMGVMALSLWLLK
ncbi:MAG: zinc transporter ZupT [Desulfomonilia bacterium]